MALSVFDDKATRPDPALLDSALGKAAVLWHAIHDYLVEACGGITDEWAFSGAKYGWSLRLVHKKRRIIYLTPQQGGFLAGIVLGDKALAAAQAAGLPEDVLAVINAAPKYGEGTGIRLDVKYKKQLPAIKTLIDIKLAN